MSYKDCAICATNLQTRTYLEVPDLDGHLTTLLQCQRCGLVYVDEPIRQNRAFAKARARSDLQSEWQAQFPDNLDVYGDQAWGTLYQNQQDAIQRPYTEVVRVLGSTLDSAATLVEIGAARGYLLAEIALHHPKLRLAGVEPSPTIAAHIRQLGIEVVNGVLEDGAFAPESVDAAVGFGSFIQVRDPRSALRHLNTVMKPGGKIMLDSPNNESLMRALFRLLWRVRALASRMDARLGRVLRLVYNPARFYFYTPNTYRQLLHEFGFRVIEVRTRQPRFLTYSKGGLSPILRTGTQMMALAEKATGREG